MNAARDDLNDLIAFIAVARERSFTRAAAKLGVSQSALSHTIRGLEERLGLRLLTRTTRSVAADGGGRATAPRHRSPFRGDRGRDGRARRASRQARRHDPHHRRRTRRQRGSVAGVEEALPEYPDIKVEIVVDNAMTDIVAERYDAGVRTRRAGGEGHDRRADRARHAHGRRGGSAIFRRTGRSRSRRRN